MKEMILIYNNRTGIAEKIAPFLLTEGLNYRAVCSHPELREFLRHEEIALMVVDAELDENGMGEGYEKTKPWHPLYNIVLFSLFGWLYMKGLALPSLSEAIITGAIWAGICIVFDVFGWVIIKHPWSLTCREFYIDYQPWITLIYAAIFIGPVIGYWFTMV